MSHIHTHKTDLEKSALVALKENFLQLEMELIPPSKKKNDWACDSNNKSSNLDFWSVYVYTFLIWYHYLKETIVLEM